MALTRPKPNKPGLGIKQSFELGHDVEMVYCCVIFRNFNKLILFTILSYTILTHKVSDEDDFEHQRKNNNPHFL